MVLSEITVAQETLCVLHCTEGLRLETQVSFNPESFLAATEKLVLIQKCSFTKYKRGLLYRFEVALKYFFRLAV